MSTDKSFIINTAIFHQKYDFTLNALYWMAL